MKKQHTKTGLPFTDAASRFCCCMIPSAQSVLHGSDTSTYVLRCVLAVLLQQLDDGRADDRAVGDITVFVFCSGVLIPKPMAQAMSVFRQMPPDQGRDDAPGSRQMLKGHGCFGVGGWDVFRTVTSPVFFLLNFGGRT